MKSRHILLILVLAILLVAPAMVGGSAAAQTSPSYDLEWHVIGGGGQPVSSASYALRSTAGQGAASPPYSTSSSYAVSGGYWFGQVSLYRIYLPLTLKTNR